MGSIFGKKSKSKSQSQSTQSSYNQAYQPLQQAYLPLLNYANEGASKFKSFLGGDRTGFDNYLKGTSYDFDQERGEGAIGTALSSKGLRNSGAMLKKLSAFNQDLKNQYSGQYLDRLAQMMGIGTGAGQILSGAGGVSSGQSTSSGTSTGPKKGLLDYGSQAAGAIAASDSRLKKNIQKIGEYEDGLGVYRFEYTYKPGVYEGVMADEVKELRPWALGPEMAGYMTVDYSRL